MNRSDIRAHVTALVRDATGWVDSESGVYEDEWLTTAAEEDIHVHAAVNELGRPLAQKIHRDAYALVSGLVLDTERYLVAPPRREVPEGEEPR